MEELVKKIKTDDKGFAGMEVGEGMGGRETPERIEWAALRALRRLLDEVDAEHHWGGLKKILTPEGHYLWLCEYHAQEYAN
jgi:hypothetical protein